MKRAKDEERMIITNAEVEIKNGALTGIEFRACHIILGPKVTMTDCVIDGSCEVKVNAK